MIQTIFFGHRLYLVLGRVKFSSSYFEQRVVKTSAEVHRVLRKSAI